MRATCFAVLLLVTLIPLPAHSQDVTAPQPKLPVREVTVFKDGHAFVLQQGKVHIGTGNTVTFTDLPNPVLGTFWPYSTDKNFPLKATVAGREGVPRERDAASVSDFLQANIGAKVRIERMLNDPKPIEGTILSLTSTSSSPAGDGVNFSNLVSAEPSFVRPIEPQTALVLLQTENGILPLPIGQVSTVQLPNGAKMRLSDTVDQNTLTLQFGDGSAGKDTDVGMMYLQRGIRWIPNYKVTLDGKGTAKIALQGTIINDLIDLSDTSMNLVIGVPNFTFKDTPDPIGMQDVFARLSRSFSSDSPTANYFSNSLMTQTRGANPGANAENGGSLPDFSVGERNEDLFLFPLKNIHLKKGQRMTLPVAQVTLPYSDVYTVELGLNSPQGNGSTDPTLARLSSGPQVKHQARLRNTSTYPLTTAPALLMLGDRVLAQSMMTCTAIGGQSDLPITDAVEINANLQDKELKRTADQVVLNGFRFMQVEMEGTITLTNYRKEPTDIEVTRYVVGEVTGASDNATITALDSFNEPPGITEYRSRNSEIAPYNKLVKVLWKRTVPAGQTVTLTYQWRYLFR